MSDPDADAFQEELNEAVQSCKKGGGKRRIRGGNDEDTIRTALDAFGNSSDATKKAYIAFMLAVQAGKSLQEITELQKAYFDEHAKDVAAEAAKAGDQASLTAQGAAEKFLQAVGETRLALDLRLNQAGAIFKAWRSSRTAYLATLGVTAAASAGLAVAASRLYYDEADRQYLIDVGHDFIETVGRACIESPALQAALLVTAGAIAGGRIALGLAPRPGGPAPPSVQQIADGAPGAQEMVPRPRRNSSRWGPAPAPQGGRRTRRRHRRRLSAPTRKGRRSSYGGRKHYSRQMRG
jgi:hypothetical protein